VQIPDENVDFICLDCATMIGGKIPEHHMPTWHYDVCPLCKVKKAVTQPRDFRLFGVKLPNTSEQDRDDRGESWKQLL